MAELRNTKRYNILDICIKLRLTNAKQKLEKIKRRGKENIFWYENAFSLQKKDVMLVAFSISTLRELKNLEPWKQIDNFLKFVLQWSN